MHNPLPRYASPIPSEQQRVDIKPDYYPSGRLRVLPLHYTHRTANLVPEEGVEPTTFPLFIRMLYH